MFAFCSVVEMWPLWEFVNLDYKKTVDFQLLVISDLINSKLASWNSLESARVPFQNRLIELDKNLNKFIDFQESINSNIDSPCKILAGVKPVQYRKWNRFQTLNLKAQDNNFTGKSPLLIVQAGTTPRRVP